MSRFNLDTCEVTEVAQVPGFTRGLQMVGDIALIGVSKVRESATFSGLPVTKLPKRVCGIWVVNIHTGAIITFIEFTSGMDEIFSVGLLPFSMVEIAGFDDPLTQANYMVDDNGIGDVMMPESPIEQAAPVFEKGNDLFNEGKKEEAIAEFKKALAIQADYLPATFNMAIALGDLGRFEEAENVLLEVVEKDASIVETYNSLGYVYYKQGLFDKARQHFEQALKIKPDYQQAKTSLEVLDREMGRS